MSGHNDTGGHGLAVTPTRAQNAFQMSAVWLAMNAVNCAVVPEPSERTMGRIGRFGSCSCLLSATMLGSFQFLMPPVKILAIVVGVSRRLVTCCPLMSRWYMNDVPPATSGMYAYGRCFGERDLVGDDGAGGVAVRRRERDLRRREVDLVLVVEHAARGGADALVVDRDALAGDVGPPLVERDLRPRGAGAVDAGVGVSRRRGDGQDDRDDHEQRAETREQAAHHPKRPVT